MSETNIAKYLPFKRVKIMSQTVHGDNASGALIKLMPDLRCTPRCHECGGSAATIHSQGYRRHIRDLNLASAKVWLQVGYRKVWCEKCDGARVEQLSFAHPSKRVTTRLASYIYGLCKVMTIKDVSEHLEIDPKTVKQIDKEYLEKDFGKTRTDDLCILMIDEIAVRKGHRYMSVVADYISGRVVWMGADRTKETLDKFFATMSEEEKSSINAVALDMWEPFINRVKHHCPQAKIVFDFFHLVKSFGSVIDKVRRDEYREATDEERKVIKGSRYILLKNEENLTDKQRDHLEEVLEINSTLSTLYVLKDHLKLIYFCIDRKKAKQVLDDWCEMASQIGHPLVLGFIRRLRFFEYGILNHAEYRISTSPLEGMNNKIKVIKRKAYGFHDDDYFALKVIQAFAA